MFLDNQFYLMNKDCKILSFQTVRDEFQDVEILELERYSDKLPIGFQNMKQWVENRKAPKHREHIDQLLKSCGCQDLDGYLRVTYALNLNDTFWVKPIESAKKWADVSLYKNEFDETIAHIAFEGGMYGEQFTTTSPEFTTDGAFAKCWIREDDEIFLLKRGMTGGRNLGKEPYCEMYASQIAAKICPDNYVPYEVVRYRGELASKCPLFTSEQIGFAPIFKCMESGAGIAKQLQYFESIGSGDDFRRMLVLDALIVNTDRHMGNYGILFDTDTLEPIKMAPVFDHNQGLLPFAEKEEFDHIDKYLESRPTRIGNDFNEVAHMVLTPEIESDLKKLRGFRFERNTKLGFPEERLVQLENVVNMQIENVLSGRKLYLPKKQNTVQKPARKIKL